MTIESFDTRSKFSKRLNSYNNHNDNRFGRKSIVANKYCGIWLFYRTRVKYLPVSIIHHFCVPISYNINIILKMFRIRFFRPLPMYLFWWVQRVIFVLYFVLYRRLHLNKYLIVVHWNHTLSTYNALTT